MQITEHKNSSETEWYTILETSHPDSRAKFI